MRFPTGFSRSTWLLAGLGLLTIAVPVALAVEAWQAAEQHRAAAERALRDQAAFAASGFRQRAVGAIYPEMAGIFEPVGTVRRVFGDGPLPPIASLGAAASAAAQCDGCAAMRPDYYFRLVFPDGGPPPPQVAGDTAGGRRVELTDSLLHVEGAPLSLARRAFVLRELAGMGDFYAARTWDYVTLTDSLAPAPGVVYLAVCRGSDGAARAVYGFGVALEPLVTTLLRPLLRDVHLLPLAAAADSGSDTLVALSLVEPHGEHVVPLSKRQMRSPFTGDVGGSMLGGWQIRAALHPTAAPLLLIGGLPPRRTALLAAMVVLVVLLVGTILLAAWRALALARLRADFVASVSHELRTPLAQILLFSESIALGRMRAPRDVHSAGRIITTETRRLMELVENLLLLGRTARETRSAAAMEPLAPLVRDVVDGFACIAIAADAGVRVARADDVAAPVEPGAARQILLNLLDNAVKHGPAGQTVTVGLAMMGARARLWVEDEGPGIPTAERERVWRPFVRLERDLAEQVPGSGIGLAVVRQLVERHGGTATIETAAGGGTRVVVEFPRAVAVTSGSDARARDLGGAACAS